MIKFHQTLDLLINFSLPANDAALEGEQNDAKCIIMCILGYTKYFVFHVHCVISISDRLELESGILVLMGTFD